MIQCLESLDSGVRALNKKFSDKVLRALTHFFPNDSIEFNGSLLDILEYILGSLTAEGKLTLAQHIVEEDSG